MTIANKLLWGAVLMAMILSPAMADYPCTTYHKQYDFMSYFDYDYADAKLVGKHWTEGDPSGDTTLTLPTGENVVRIRGDVNTRIIECLNGGQLRANSGSSYCEVGDFDFERIDSSTGIFSCRSTTIDEGDPVFAYSCINVIGVSYEEQDDTSCVNGDVYWYDSLGCRGDIKEYCSSSETCSGGTCRQTCDAGYIGEPVCDGDMVVQDYQDSFCETESKVLKKCTYGCDDGTCISYTCTDSDSGLDYYEQGVTYGLDDGEQVSKSDYCDGKVLHEYYCDCGNIVQITHTCSTCDDGACQAESCRDQCEYGERECAGDDEYRICGYFDTDVCLDWKYVECDGDCDDGYCEYDDDDDDECDRGYENDYRCRGDWRQRLYIESDCDERWRNYEYCEYGCYNDRCLDYGYPQPPNPPVYSYCGNGICSGTETCSSCPLDCGACRTCGDGLCQEGENAANCAIDCAPQSTYVCGNGRCEAGEACDNCPTDCGICDSCGDGFCTGGESCLNCKVDCGVCVTPTVDDDDDYVNVIVDGEDSGSDEESDDEGSGTPTGAVTAGEFGLSAIWLGIIALAIVNIVLFAVFFAKKVRS